MGKESVGWESMPWHGNWESMGMLAKLEVGKVGKYEIQYPY